MSKRRPVQPEPKERGYRKNNRKSKRRTGKKRYKKRIKDHVCTCKPRLGVRVCENTPFRLDNITLLPERILEDLKANMKFGSSSRERKDFVNLKREVLGKKQETAKQLNLKRKFGGLKSPLEYLWTKEDENLISPCGCQGLIAFQNRQRRIAYSEKLRHNGAHQAKNREKAINDFFNRLSTPKPKIESTRVSEWKLTKLMRNFEPSFRVVGLAEPKMKLPPLDKTSLGEGLQVKQSALQYRVSNRLMELAQPKRIPLIEPKDPRQVLQRALNAKVSDRIIQLASPKKRIDQTVRKHPFVVKPRALRENPSIHTSLLAQSHEAYFDYYLRGTPKEKVSV